MVFAAVSKDLDDEAPYMPATLSKDSRETCKDATQRRYTSQK